MATKRFALIFGIIYTLIGLAGFIPGLLSALPAGAPDVSVDTMHGMLLGIFPVNILHSIVHLLIGLWGIVASRDWDAAKTYAKANAVLFALLAVMGLIPGANTTFGLIPLWGNDIWLHVLNALVAGYFGFVHADRRVEAV